MQTHWVCLQYTPRGKESRFHRSNRNNQEEHFPWKKTILQNFVDPLPQTQQFSRIFHEIFLPPEVSFLPLSWMISVIVQVFRLFSVVVTHVRPVRRGKRSHSDGVMFPPELSACDFHSEKDLPYHKSVVRSTKFFASTNSKSRKAETVPLIRPAFTFDECRRTTSQYPDAGGSCALL